MCATYCQLSACRPCLAGKTCREFVGVHHDVVALIQTTLVELISNRTGNVHAGSVLSLTANHYIRDAQPLACGIAGVPRIDANLQLVALLQLDNRSDIHIVHHTAGHRSRRINGSTRHKAVGRIIDMALHSAASVSTNLHCNVVDVQLGSVRTSHGELHILVGGVVLSLHPGTALTGADHQAFLSVVAILHHTLYLSVSCIGQTVNSGFVIAGQRPCNGKRSTATQFNGIHRYIGNNLLATECSSHGTVEHANSSSSHLGIEGLDNRSALITYL